jgi:hypothetical protein
MNGLHQEDQIKNRRRINNMKYKDCKIIYDTYYLRDYGFKEEDKVNHDDLEAENLHWVNSLYMLYEMKRNQEPDCEVEELISLDTKELFHWTRETIGCALHISYDWWVKNVRGI